MGAFCSLATALAGRGWGSECGVPASETRKAALGSLRDPTSSGKRGDEVVEQAGSPETGQTADIEGQPYPALRFSKACEPEISNVGGNHSRQGRRHHGSHLWHRTD